MTSLGLHIVACDTEIGTLTCTGRLRQKERASKMFKPRQGTISYVSGLNNYCMILFMMNTLLLSRILKLHSDFIIFK
jgi:hypothetical protein